ncbi:sensor histidine kinase [Cellulomonas shaoxiangyii]|uniref:histidine kinase n=1 Tax=Cellulomonas shaoxiangyii TaxID=2566013 RepID=A0A4P7SGW5_9CELL|nr:sensor histidine kinase [Cellulomonas shaoxiangyii]QCB92326.1 sensor histidine kinase [Cellulomonas shaoxiangyii]TGY86280.1 sensor histidine kinase [Cellulomonas shaoxiangyii]
MPSEPVAARARRRAARTLDALEHVVGGLGTGVLALMVLLALVLTALLCVVGVGLLLAPGALRAVRAVADRERTRLSHTGATVVSPGPLPDGLRAQLADPDLRRELLWTVEHATVGVVLGLVAVTLPFSAVRDVTVPLWWRAFPDEVASTDLMSVPVTSWPDAFVVFLMGVGWFLLAVLVLPPLARLQAWPGRVLLAPPPGTDLALRVAQLTATRAGALDAHVAELRRIERSLHDGTQNRLVAVTVLLGAARRAVVRDPADAEALLERAQSAAEEALAELRAVARSILPPVLTDRSLADALTGLASSSLVPCALRVDLPVRCAASVEATAYFTVAEALTNAARHSGAGAVNVDVAMAGDRLRVVVTDDGEGGADEAAGSGLAGIRRRTEAHDGSLQLTSPRGGPTTLEVTLPCGS